MIVSLCSLAYKVFSATGSYEEIVTHALLNCVGH